MCANVQTDETSLIYVQYGGFRKRGGACEFAGLMHKLLAREIESLGDGGAVKQQLSYSLYVVCDNSAGCFMCAGSTESPSYHVTALMRCSNCVYVSEIHDRLCDAVRRDGICTRAGQCCGYTVRLIPPYIHKSISDAWRERLIAPPSDSRTQ
jgi:hypothetical protein